MQAPVIWDADNADDLATAKRGCNGTKGNGINKGSSPCPIRTLCLEAAIESNSTYGVWGGKSPMVRKQIKAKRNRLTNLSDGSK